MIMKHPDTFAVVMEAVIGRIQLDIDALRRCNIDHIGE